MSRLEEEKELKDSIFQSIHVYYSKRSGNIFSGLIGITLGALAVGLLFLTNCTVAERRELIEEVKKEREHEREMEKLEQERD